MSEADNQAATPEPASNAPLNEFSAAAELARFFDDPTEEKPKEHEDEASDAKPEPEGEPEQDKPEAEAAETENEDDPTVVVKIDGKEVEVKLSELKNGYQRQADYTRKTMEVAEQRKAAESEITKARQERENYAQSLQQAQALLQAQLAEYQNVDWQKLIATDPIEYLKQKEAFEQRQSKLQQVFAEQQRLGAMQQAETEKARNDYLKQQESELLAKLPEWKDESKAKAEKDALRDFLLSSGFTKDEVGNVSDHRAVIMARKAMLYDQMVSKAQTAAKKVEKLPQKVERPSSGQPVNLDKRNVAWQRLNKTGSVNDAAAVLASFI